MVNGASKTLVGEAEMQNVAVLHFVFLAFKAHFASFLATRLAVEFDEVVISDSFRANEAFFKIRVDDACRAGRHCAGFDCPGPVSYTHLTLPTNREV